MLFNTIQYALFLGLVLATLRLVPARARSGVLLIASTVFYAMWLPAYLLLLLVDLIVNYLLLKAMVRSLRPRRYLIASIAFTLCLLAGFKYAAFAVAALLPVLEMGFGFSPDVPSFFLPLGISFYSFQIIALAVDTYRRELKPVESFARYSLFISFFPQLIAGPILRGAKMLPQLAVGGTPTPERTRRGGWLLVSGLVKKVVFADFLLAPFVDGAFEAPGLGSAAYHLVTAYSFAFQIYFDFSGYVDMARGSALLMGFEIPTNFLEPYLSRNPAEFWRRWHITLSTWLRDYLYIPLGGNRQGTARTYVNLWLTMLLGGLWHGAAWTFVVWGGLHGLLLVVHRLIGGSANDIDRPITARDIPGILVTFHAAALLFAVFRAPSLAEAGVFFSQFAAMDFFAGWPPVQTAIVLLCIGSHFFERWLRGHVAALQQLCAEHAWGPAAEGLSAGILIGLAYALSGAGGEFIYFQF
jgi:D-alanyl-lipoteichoic acid acyltransferase DltB (MBOAT superfamily)